jgi:hypothetical protein
VVRPVALLEVLVVAPVVVTLTLALTAGLDVDGDDDETVSSMPGKGLGYSVGRLQHERRLAAAAAQVFQS